MGNLVKSAQNVATNLQKAEDVGMGEVFWDRLRSDLAFAARMGHHAQNGGFDSATLGDQPYFGQDIKVFGWNEWEEFTSVESDREKAEQARNAFPWVGQNMLELFESPDLSNPGYADSDHFVFYAQRSFNDCQDRFLEDLTMENLEFFSRAYVNWPNHPKIVFEEEIPASDLDWIEPPSDGWIAVCTPVCCKHGEIPEDYELATASEYLLAMILYFQKYGNLDFFSRGADMLGTVLTANSWEIFRRFHKVGFSIGKQGIWVDSAGVGSDMPPGWGEDPHFWALKRKPPK